MMRLPVLYHEVKIMNRRLKIELDPCGGTKLELCEPMGAFWYAVQMKCKSAKWNGALFNLLYIMLCIW